MQDPEEDTEWNDVLRSKGILPPKEVEVTEDELAELAEGAVREHLIKTGQLEKDVADMTLDELDELDDPDGEKALEGYRAQRMAELKALSSKSHFGDVINITAREYKKEVNEAGKDIWVVLLLYKSDMLVCRRLQQIIASLAKRYPRTKFVQSPAQSCIPNYPDRNCPSLFIYLEDAVKEQLVGNTLFGGERMTELDVEIALATIGAIEATKEELEDRDFGAGADDNGDDAGAAAKPRTVRGSSRRYADDDDSDEED